MGKDPSKKRLSRASRDSEGGEGGTNAKQSVDDSIYTPVQSTAQSTAAAFSSTPVPDELAEVVVAPPTPQLLQKAKSKSKATRQPRPSSTRKPALKRPKDQGAFLHYMPPPSDSSLLQVPERPLKKRLQRQRYSTLVVATPSGPSSTQSTPVLTADTPSDIAMSSDTFSSVAAMSPDTFQSSTPSSSMAASPDPQIQSPGQRPYPYHTPPPKPPPLGDTQTDTQSPVGHSPRLAGQPIAIFAISGPSYQLADDPPMHGQFESFTSFHAPLAAHSLLPGPPLRRIHRVLGQQAPVPQQFPNSVPAPHANTAEPTPGHNPSYQSSVHPLVYSDRPFGLSPTSSIPNSIGTQATVSPNPHSPSTFLVPGPDTRQPHHAPGHQAPALQQSLGPVSVPHPHTGRPAYMPFYQSPLVYDHRPFGPSPTSFTPNPKEGQVPVPQNLHTLSDSLAPGPYAQRPHPVPGHQAPTPQQSLGSVPVSHGDTSKPHIPSYQVPRHPLVYGDYSFGPSPTSYIPNPIDAQVSPNPHTPSNSLAPGPDARQPRHIVRHEAPAHQQSLGHVPHAVPPANTTRPAQIALSGHPLVYDHRPFRVGPSPTSFAPNPNNAPVPVPQNPHAPSNSLGPGPYARRPRHVAGRQAPAPQPFLGSVPQAVLPTHTARPAHIPLSGHPLVSDYHPLGPSPNSVVLNLVGAQVHVPPNPHAPSNSLGPRAYARRPHDAPGRDQAPAPQQFPGSVPASHAHVPSYPLSGHPLADNHLPFGPPPTSFIHNPIGAHVPMLQNPYTPSNTLAPGIDTHYTHPYYEYPPGPYSGA